MNKYNCPNCGAPITGPRCAYCDTLLVEPIYYQYKIPYPGGGGANCNIRQQLEEALAQTAQNVQINCIMANNAIQSMLLYSYESGLRIDRF